MYLPTVLVVCYRCCKLRSWLPSCLGFSCRCTSLMGWCLPRFSSASHGSSSTLGCRGGVPRFARHRHTQSHSFSFRGSSGIWTLSSTFGRASTCVVMLSGMPGRLHSAISEAGSGCVHHRTPQSLCSLQLRMVHLRFLAALLSRAEKFGIDGP